MAAGSRLSLPEPPGTAATPSSTHKHSATPRELCSGCDMAHPPQPEHTHFGGGRRKGREGGWVCVKVWEEKMRFSSAGGGDSSLSLAPSSLASSLCSSFQPACMFAHGHCTCMCVRHVTGGRSLHFNSLRIGVGGDGRSRERWRKVGRNTPDNTYHTSAVMEGEDVTLMELFTVKQRDPVEPALTSVCRTYITCIRSPTLPRPEGADSHRSQ